MKEFLFSSQWLGIAIGLVFLAVAYIGWTIKRYEFNKLWFLPGVLVIVAMAGLDRLVETDREQLLNATKMVIEAAENEDADLLLANVSRNLRLDNGLGYTEAAERIRRFFDRPLVASNMINELKLVQVSENRAVVELTVSTVVDPKSRYALARLLRTSWRFTFGKDADGRFRITNIEMINMEGGEPIDVFSFRP